jgi:putative SOS response-associated peptidase YedK
MFPLHHRLPVILQAADQDRWLDPGGQDTERPQGMRLFPGDALITHPVSTWVNSPAHDSPERIAPLV